MALNCVMLDGHRKPIALPTEKFSISVPGTTLEISRENRKLVGQGCTWVSTHRLIFIADRDKTGSDAINSFTIPLQNIRDNHLAQPLFRAIYWRAEIIPVPDAGLTPGHHNLKLSFNEGCSFEFVQAFGEVTAALEALGSNTPHLEPLPLYIAEAQSQTTTGMPSPSLMEAMTVVSQLETAERRENTTPADLPPGYN